MSDLYFLLSSEWKYHITNISLMFVFVFCVFAYKYRSEPNFIEVVFSRNVFVEGSKSFSMLIGLYVLFLLYRYAL